MERITTQDLEREVGVLNGYFGIRDNDAPERFAIYSADGTHQLVKNNGSRNISKRGTKREIYEQLYAINKVIYEFKQDFEEQTGFAVDDLKA